MRGNGASDPCGQVAARASGITGFRLLSSHFTHKRKSSWKKEVKKAIKIKNEKELRRDIGKLEKVKQYAKENFQQKRYFKDLNLDEARAIFKHR